MSEQKQEKNFFFFLMERMTLVTNVGQLRICALVVVIERCSIVKHNSSTHTHTGMQIF